MIKWAEITREGGVGGLMKHSSVTMDVGAAMVGREGSVLDAAVPALGWITGRHSLQGPRQAEQNAVNSQVGDYRPEVGVCTGLRWVYVQASDGCMYRPQVGVCVPQG